MLSVQLSVRRFRSPKRIQLSPRRSLSLRFRIWLVALAQIAGVILFDPPPCLVLETLLPLKCHHRRCPFSALEGCPSLEYLNLSSNPELSAQGDAGMQALAPGPSKPPKLRELLLSNCELGAEAGGRSRPASTAAPRSSSSPLRATKRWGPPARRA